MVLPILFSNWIKPKWPKWKNSQIHLQNASKTKRIGWKLTKIEQFQIALQNGTKTAFALFFNLHYDYCWKSRVTNLKLTFLFLDGLIKFLMILFRIFFLFRIKFMILHFGLFSLGSCKSLQNELSFFWMRLISILVFMK